MNLLNTAFVLAAAFLAVFWAAAFHGLRHLLGAQIDLLPPLMVYAGLRANLTTVALTAFFGGVAFDSLSANPLGISVMPLFVVGFVIHQCRELVLRDQAYAQFVLGVAASTVSPLLTLLFLLTTGHKPVFGWGTLWQFVVMSIGGGIATPVFVVFFSWLENALMHGRVAESSFRADREIRRGRI